MVSLSSIMTSGLSSLLLFVMGFFEIRVELLVDVCGARVELLVDVFGARVAVRVLVSVPI